jgi:spore coat polysaccharide biosynthesis protein SpsF (cytidylyltransferase family)
MIPVFILARATSTRLPRKHFLDFGGRTVIEHMVLRCQHFGFKPHLCVPFGEAEEFNKHLNYVVDIFGGDRDNVENRLLQAAKYFKIDQFHALDGDDLFFDEDEIYYSGPYYKSLAPRISESGNGICGTSYSLDIGNKDERRFQPNRQYPWPQRLTLDYPEDYHLLLAVTRMVGGFMAPRSAVDELFVRNPDLHKINWFRTEEWKMRQLKERRL